MHKKSLHGHRSKNMMLGQQLAGKFSLPLLCILFHSLLSYYTSYFAGLSCCHTLSSSLSAALVVSIIHHLHSQAIYTSFYSQSAFLLHWLHLSTLIRLFQLPYAVLGHLQILGLKQHHYRYSSVVWTHTFCYQKRRNCCIINIKRLRLRFPNFNLALPIPKLKFTIYYIK